MEEPITDFFVANAVLAEVTELDVETMWLLYRVECTGEDFYNAAADRVDGSGGRGVVASQRP